MDVKNIKSKGCAMRRIELSSDFRYPTSMKQYNYKEFLEGMDNVEIVTEFECPRCKTRSIGLASVNQTGDEVAYLCDCGLCFQRWHSSLYIWENVEKEKKQIEEYVDLMSEYQLTEEQLQKMFSEMKDVIENSKISGTDKVKTGSPFRFPDPSTVYQKPKPKPKRPDPLKDPGGAVIKPSFDDVFKDAVKEVKKEVKETKEIFAGMDIGDLGLSGSTKRKLQRLQEKLDDGSLRKKPKKHFIDPAIFDRFDEKWKNDYSKRYEKLKNEVFAGIKNFGSSCIHWFDDKPKPEKTAEKATKEKKTANKSKKDLTNKKYCLNIRNIKIV